MDCFNRCFAADSTAAMLVVSYAVGFLCRHVSLRDAFPSEEDSCVTTQLAVTEKTTMLVIRTKAFPFPKNYKIFKQILPPLPPPQKTLRCLDL